MQGSFKILYVTATSAEAETLARIMHLDPFPEKLEKYDLIPLITGVGGMATAWSLKQWIDFNGKPDFAINAGIAGSYSDKFAVGDVVMAVSDCFADAGVEAGNDFYTLQEAGLAAADEFPYKDGVIYSGNIYTENIKNIIKPASAITVNTATGSETSIGKIVKKFNPDIETMEGATFFYICSRENIPFMALRAISNRVESRNKKKWNIDLALNNLSEKLMEVLLTLH